MVSTIKSCTVNGMCAEITNVECDVSRGMPMLNIVGLPDAAVRESKERLRAAINNSGLNFPLNKRITVNLSPAGTKKEGTHLDLAMALSLLLCAEDIYNERIDKTVVLGELSLDGRVNPVRNISSVLIALKGLRVRSAVIPYENLSEAIIIEGIDLIPVRTLSEAYGYMSGSADIKKVKGKRPEPINEEIVFSGDYSEVKGRLEAKRAVVISISGGHHLLFTGPPGCGKSMIAKRIPTVIPDMEYEEMLETMSIYGVSNTEICVDAFRYKRPFRAPAANVSPSAMIGGGGGIPKPGEISLAHNGVLFLDEMPEFRRDVLEALRQPLEDGQVSISRTSGKITYPCRFILVGARNPCPCGYLNDPEHGCSCTPMQIKRYNDKLSGPIMDRFDLFVDMMPETGDAEKNSFSMKEEICRAREIQKERYINEEFKYNSQLTGRFVRKYCFLDKESRDMYETGCSALKVSRRGADKILRVARTIADLDGEENIRPQHLAEAFQFRRRDGSEI